jgi:exopolysaccharide biosynthesis polyprenyl glycosylphosphotransferase
MTISRKKRQFFIAIVDVMLISLAVFLSLWIRRDFNVPSFARFWRHFVVFIPIIVAWIVCLYTAGLYSLEVPHTGYRAISYLAIIAVICTLFGFALFYLNLKARIVPKTILVIHSCVVAMLIMLWRWFFSKIAMKNFATVNIAFVGINDTVIELLENASNFSYMSYKVMFLYNTEKPVDYKNDGIPVINDPMLFIDEIKKKNIQMVVVSNKKNLPGATQNVLFELLRNHIYFIDLPDFYEIFLRRIPLDAVNELWFLTSIDLQSKRIYRIVKRTADVMMAMMLFVLSLPFWLFIMLLIKLESPGPVFFKQMRVGYLEKPFTIIKFRTMKVVGNTQQPTRHNDSRVTTFGKFLRRTRIDEIPQFLNVLKSDMSFIGPRPERPELIQELEREVPFYRQRLLVKPGLSGWDQVSGEYHSPSREDTYKKLQYDLYYIKNMSFFLDVSIFFKTLVTMIKRAGV